VSPNQTILGGTKRGNNSIGMAASVSPPEQNISIRDVKQMSQTTTDYEEVRLTLEKDKEERKKTVSGTNLVFGVFGTDNYMSVDDLFRDLRIKINEIALGQQEFIDSINERVMAMETKLHDDAVKMHEKQ
jgi:hypothetical protein